MLSLSLFEPYHKMASTSSAPPTTMLAGTVESILTPGTNPGLVRAMNVTFGALFVVLSGMVWLTGANGHVIVLLLLSMFSFGSITWYASLVRICGKNDARAGN